MRESELDGRRGSPLEVFTVFLGLGLTSFGGPIAHLGYFRRELVEKRRWISDGQFAQLLALSQFLPGPASSQLGFSLGLLRAGWAGALLAFLGFTLPSACLMLAFAAWLPRLSGELGLAALHGLELVALAVVAQGVLGMASKLCPDGPRATIAALAAVVVLLVGGALAQLLVVAGGALAGLAFGHPTSGSAEEGLGPRYGRRAGAVLLVLFVLLLALLPAVAPGSGGLLDRAEAFYRSGALVFGGGHVVLPLLEDAIVDPGWVSLEDFLAGYGAAQAVPGPMFSFAAFLGARAGDGISLPGSLVATLAIFLPGFLLVAGFLPWWRALASRPLAGRSVSGVNAAVVGLLGAALYDPIWVNAARGSSDVAIALVAFLLLRAWRAPALVVVLWCVGASLLRATF